MTRRPTRKRKHDRQTHGIVSREEQVTHMTVAPFDRMARAMDEKWGIDRLPELVDPVKVERWGEVMAELNDAIAANDPDRTRSAVEVAMKGLAVMDAAAEASGHDPKPPALIEGEADGFRFGIMTDDRRWPTYEAENPGVLLFSLRQVGLALKDRTENSPALQEVRKHFPNATVTATRPQTALDLSDALGGDEIPF